MSQTIQTDPWIQTPVKKPSVRAGMSLFNTRPRAILFVILMGAVASSVTSLIVWRHDLFPKRWQVVEPDSLYRSGQLSRSLIERVLTNQRIQVVVDLTGREPQDLDQAAEDETCELLGIEHTRFPLSGDGTGEVELYAAAVTAIDRGVREGKPVLVHCASGIQRTGGVLAAYRLLVQREKLEIVMDQLSGTANGLEPVNPKLIAFLNDNFDEIGAILVNNETIDSLPDPLPKLPPL